MAEVFEEVSDLGGGDAEEGERREIIFGEKLGASGFVAVLRSATGEFGKEEELVGMEGVRRMAVEIAVEHGGEFGDADFVARFLTSFACGGDGRRLADIGPSAGKSPAAVFEFADEEDAAVLEYGDARVNFGSGVAGLLGKDFDERGRIGE